jgi:hypothetical protein
MGEKHETDMRVGLKRVHIGVDQPLVRCRFRQADLGASHPATLLQPSHGCLHGVAQTASLAGASETVTLDPSAASSFGMRVLR